MTGGDPGDVEALTIEVRRDFPNNRIHLTAVVSEGVLQSRFGPAILHAFSEGVRQALVERWLDQHAADVLEQLAPGAVGEEVRKLIAQRVLTALEKGKT